MKRNPALNMAFVWIVLSIILQSSALVLIKWASRAETPLIELMRSPAYLCALAALGGQAICWIMALRKYPLSFAYPFMSLTFILNLMAAGMIFAESIHGLHLAGTSLIVAGVVLVGRSQFYAPEEGAAS